MNPSFVAKLCAVLALFVSGLVAQSASVTSATQPGATGLMNIKVSMSGSGPITLLKVEFRNSKGVLLAAHPIDWVDANGNGVADVGEYGNAYEAPNIGVYSIQPPAGATEVRVTTSNGPSDGGTWKKIDQQ